MNEAEAQSENEIADNIDSEEIPEDQEEIDIPAEDEDFNEAEDQTEEAIEDDSAFDDEDFSYDDTEYEESESEDDNELREETMLVIEDKDITLDLNGHTLDRNLYAADADGHVIIVRSNAILYLTNNSDKEAIITGGFANNGGAINNKGILYVDNVAFKDNHASYTDGKTIGRGGAIYKEGTLTMRGCIIGGYTDDESNSVSDGGAIYNNTTGDIFLKDDLTLINFEGTLTESTYVPKGKTKDDFIFSISPSYVSVLPDNGVEAVALDNNHVRDHGEEGLEDTKQALREAGVEFSTPLETGVWNYKGIIQVAMLSYNCIDRYDKGFKSSKYRDQYTESFLQHDTFEEAVCAEIQAAKEIYPVVIVSFHWGNEKFYAPTKNQIRMGRMAADAGADLVVGHHSHRIQPIEYYNGTLICYSLANFCFSGNNGRNWDSKDMSSYILQVRFRVKEDGSATYKDFRIIPIRISSTKGTNNFMPTPFSDGAELDTVLNTMTDRINIADLPYAITDLKPYLEFH